MDESKLSIKRYRLKHVFAFSTTILLIFLWYYHLPNTKIKFIGLIISTTGLLIWWAGKITLSKNWNFGYGKPKIKNLVTNGIYSKIKHPIYLGINITLMGLMFFYTKIWFIIVGSLIIFYFFRRMYVEDKYLTKKLGKKYIEYKKKTWF